ncbi:MAG: endonuclease domain-containing protein [Bryobacteraceae bacterium]
MTRCRTHTARNLHSRYGMSTSDYDTLLARQQGACAGCGRLHHPDNVLHVDHDHTSETVRGLLCNSCNSVLGFAHDDPTILYALVAYLVHPPASA